MSDPASPTTAPGHTIPGKLPFSTEEIASFRASDQQAGAAIIYLMSGVFSTGLIMYIIVALTVASAPG